MEKEGVKEDAIKPSSFRLYQSKDGMKMKKFMKPLVMKLAHFRKLKDSAKPNLAEQIREYT